MDALKPIDKYSPADSGVNQSESDASIQWFRQASPYINAHRGKVFVLYMSGSAVFSKDFATLINDIALLSNLGVKLVLVHGLRDQIDTQLDETGVRSDFHHDLRVTDAQILQTVISEVGKARIFIESRLSMGLPNTPMSGAHLSVASGNFVTAQPYGVVDGIDFEHTGMVRQIHSGAIRRQIDNGQLVLLSPLGYSRTGEVFNLAAEDIAMHAAEALGAEKLIYLTDKTIRDVSGNPVRESTPSGIEALLPQLPDDTTDKRVIQRAVDACRAGVKRVHIISEHDTDGLLKELFTRDGTGTMINADNYETIRQATIQDVGGIIELIHPLEENGTLVKRSREQLEIDIARFSVAERDGMIVACAALLPDPDPTAGIAEIACMVTHPNYRNSGRAETLLTRLQDTARLQGIETLFALTTRTGHWFIEQGFVEKTIDELTASRIKCLNLHRNSKVLIKRI